MGIQAAIWKGVESGLSHADRMIRTGMSLYLIARQKKYKISSRGKGGTLYILSGGPSLRQQLDEHGAFLAQQDTLCCKGMSMSREYVNIRPKYYTYEATCLINQEKLHQAVRTEVAMTFKDIVEKTNWEMVLFLPEYAQQNNELIKYIQSNPFIKIKYFSTFCYEGYDVLKHKLIKAQLAGFPNYNSLIGEIKLGIWLGYERMYLLGADHDFLPPVFVDDENNIFYSNNHFYDSEKQKPIILVGEDGTKLTYVQYLDFNAKIFNEYWEIAKFAKRESIAIYNATRGSFIDAFERRYTLEG